MIDGVAKATQQGDAEFVYHAKDSDFRSGSGTGLLIEEYGFAINTPTPGFARA